MFVLRCIFLCAGILFSLQAAAACDVTDDAGSNIKISHSAEHIIVLSPDLVETMFAIGAGNKVIGVVQGSDFPAQARKISSVGSYSGIDLERIVTMHPDLIITWKYAFPRQVAALRQLGFPVYVSAPKKLEDVPRLMRQLGCLTGKNAAAEKAAQQFEDDLHALASVKRKPLNVFFQIGEYALITVNHDSWINQVMALCGGRNIFADAKTIAPEVSREAVLAANPDVILADATSNSWKKSWQAWPEMRAVARQHLFTIDPDLIARAGPRLVLGARQVCAYMDAARNG